MHSNEVGERIRERRRKLHLRLEDVAQATGLSVPTLSKLETGKQALRYSDLARIAPALSCAVHDLIPPPTYNGGPAIRRKQVASKAKKGRVAA